MEDALTAASVLADRDVHQGDDGWLFLVGGSNQVLRFMTEPDAFPDSAVEAWLTLMRERRERCRTFGTTYVHLIAPEKLTVYHEKFRGDLPCRQRSPAWRLPAAARHAELGDVVADPLAYFMRNKDDYKLYWQTDTHWTFEGCLCAYQILCGHLGVKPNPGIWMDRTSGADLLLDLGSKLDPPVREFFTLGRFLQHARRVAANPLVVFKERMQRENEGGLHVGSNVVFCNFGEAAVRKRVVLFGDSFSEYRPHLLTGMLAETFQEVHFVWSTSLDWSYIERVKPDLLITEAAERFANQVPRDDFNLDSYVVQCLAPLMRAAPG